MRNQFLVVVTFLIFTQVFLGCSESLTLQSPNPVRAYIGSNALFKWNVSKDFTSQPDFEKFVFGIWGYGHLATYITTVKKSGRIIPNPELNRTASQFHKRIQWKGDLTQSLVAFEISNISSQDQLNYGLVLDFGFFRNTESDVVSLQVKERASSIIAEPSTNNSGKPGQSASFLCDFYVNDKDISVYRGVTVGLCTRGGISLTLVSLTEENNFIINPDLSQEGPEYVGRVSANVQRVNSNTQNFTRISLTLRNTTTGDDRVYGCSMDLGPFKEPIVAIVKIDVKDSSVNVDSGVVSNPFQQSLKVHLGTDVNMSCPELANVIKMDGTFYGLRWSYCESNNCTEPDTKWKMLAGMDQERKIKVGQAGSYARRVNLTQDGTLGIKKVRESDATDYRCTVERINDVSSWHYFVTLEIDTTERPKITKKSQPEVTVVEGNTLFLECEAEGNPKPNVSWEKSGKILKNSTTDTNFVLHNVKKEHSGRYKCSATNSVGSVSYAVDVTVDVTDKGHKNGKALVISLTVVSSVLVCVLVFGFLFLFRKRTRARCTRKTTTKAGLERTNFLAH